MGNTNKKNNPKIQINKGTIEDDTGKKYNIDFVGDNDDFVNISYDDDKKSKNDPIKELLKKITGTISSICFIKKYKYLLVGCKDGYLYTYDRLINNKSNLKFEQIIQFQPHKANVIQILELQSGLILTLSSDSSAKIFEIIIDSNIKGNISFTEQQILLNEINDNTSNNSAIELKSGNLIVSQGFFINFFEKKNLEINENEEKITFCRTNSIFNLSEKIFHLTKKIFTNSDNISFIEIDTRIFAASQIVNKTLQLYDFNNYSLVKNISKIEFNNLRNNMCLINEGKLAIGGINGSVYLISLQQRQIYSVIHLDNCDNISCIKVLDDNKLILGGQFWNINYDIVVLKIEDNNELTEVDRIKKIHSGLIDDIKLVSKEISNNNNSFNEKYNLITVGQDFKVKLILRKEEDFKNNKQ